MTVWRKLPTIMPTEVIIAIAVESAPTSTDVRRSEPARLREASIVSTPRNLPISVDAMVVNQYTSAGIESAEAAIRNNAERYPNSGLSEIAGRNAAITPNTPSSEPIRTSRVRSTRIAYSRRPRAIASVGGTSDASRAGASADATATPIPIAKASITDVVERLSGARTA